MLASGYTVFVWSLFWLFVLDKVSRVKLVTGACSEILILLFVLMPSLGFSFGTLPPSLPFFFLVLFYLQY